MTNSHPDSEQSYSGTSQNGVLEIPDFPTGAAKDRFSSQVVNIDRRTPSNTVFHIDDTTFTPSMPRGTHWSIAWSDLMMTMFVLFLCMFVYQTANQEFLQEKDPEIIGGDTTEAIQSLDSSGASLPFSPINPALPLKTLDSVKKVEKVEMREIDPEIVFLNDPTREPDRVEFKKKPPAASSEPAIPDKTGSLGAEDQREEIPEPDLAPAQTSSTTSPRSEPILSTIPEPPKADTFQEIYDLSKGALATNNLDQFASIDIVPDKTVRIILTGDLLFALGDDRLSKKAKRSLQKIGAVIQQTPYMINIVGHTDNLPMHSQRFQSNWELSVARASSVARFLMDTMRMNPKQFVVSGYSSYRPVLPNTTAENRAKNRRVEIIISKRLPLPLPATANNLN